MGVSYKNLDLIGATSAYPLRGTFVCPAGEVVNLGVPSDGTGTTFILAGIDVFVPAVQTAPWIVKASTEPAGLGFWGFNAAMTTTSLDYAIGGYGGFRGGMPTPPDEDYLVEFDTGGIDAPGIEGAWWGYLISSGWSPVGLPPQQ